MARPARGGDAGRIQAPGAPPRDPQDPVPRSPRPSAPVFDLQRVRDVLVAQKVVILAFTLAALAAGVGATAVATRWYTAVAVIQFLPRAGQEVTAAEVLKLDDGGYMEGRDRARTQIQIIQSRGVREEAIRRYRSRGHTDLQLTAESLDWLGRHLTAGPREDTQLVEIRVEHRNPESAALLANLVAQVYYEANLDFRRNAARETQGWITEQAKVSEGRLEEANAALLAFKAANGLVDAEADQDDISARLAALQQALGAATTDRVLVGSQLAEHERLLAMGATDVLAGMFDDLSLAAVSREQAELRTRAAEVRGRYGELHPEHQRVEAHLAQVSAVVAGEVRRLVDAERSRYQALQRQEQRLGAELDTVKGLLLQQQRLRDEYDRLKRDEETARRLVGSLGDRGVEVDLQAQTQLSDVRIVDLALPPEDPSKPNVPINLALSLVMGLAGGLALALFRHQQSDVLLTAQDVEDRTDLPVLGAIPLLPNSLTAAQRPLYPLVQPHSLTAEAFRAVRAMIQHHAPGDDALCLMVTSGIAGEGKTTSIVGLGAAFARMGLRTIIVDADLRRPRVHEVFSEALGQGLSEMLSVGLDPQQVLRKTREPNLSFISAGQENVDSVELLASHKMQRLLDELRTGFQIVLVDTPPAGVVADALGMAPLLDGVVLVVRRDHAPGRVVVEAVQRLRQAEARVIGTVFNASPPNRDALRYGKGYYTEARPQGRRQPG